jgi:hypothetical protein
MEHRDEPEDRHDERPPGHFMDERLEADTRRFLEEVRQLAAHRAERPKIDDTGD